MANKLEGFYPLKTKELRSEKCANCGKTGSIEIGIYISYVMYSVLAMMPASKEGRSRCKACGKVLEPDEMTPSVRAEYYQLYAVTKTPLSAYFGLILLMMAPAALLGIHVFESMEKKALIDAPIVGDVYSSFLNERYSTIRVAAVSGDSVLLEYNREHATSVHKSERSGPRQVLSYDYAPGVWTHKDQILKMYEDDQIVDVLEQPRK